MAISVQGLVENSALAMGIPFPAPVTFYQMGLFALPDETESGFPISLQDIADVFNYPGDP